ncbi:deoxyribodipyrimidine photo-lyase [Desulfohalobium retbaense]|uniref:Deoxyribodipyrimidine photo-lyase n=1 Tax=Desulfohalobium retbaense (strain ATCC 49708 / DSM 5692 / JCM 16813 / HR100) TaxID=485915 RepID=C8X2G2_DESRD|nr:deoxyribodipyrimidine photo-lyase [Desulfohalobium retbaense]ACV68609.1 deoxyribodipyrimidine photolyase [Desulfohalobium retbaense DSM 5692]
MSLPASPVHAQRLYCHTPSVRGSGPVAYWMSRDQRLHDNWALLQAQHMARTRQAPLIIVFCLVPSYSGGARRHFDFMLTGLRQVADSAAKLGIPFVLLTGEDPPGELAGFCRTHAIGTVVMDFDPLRTKQQWQHTFAGHWEGECLEVDAHNVVPCRWASEKQEYAARTIRPKLQRQLPEFLDPFPELVPHPVPWRGSLLPEPDWEAASRSLAAPEYGPPLSWSSGEETALDLAREFIASGLSAYAEKRNDPTAGAVSGLSPYLHFGQIAPQRVALMARDANWAPAESREGFLEELVIRRELAENFCFYNPVYDCFGGLPAWAQQTLDDHRGDHREVVYTFEQWEAARTHDPLWNAAQQEMVQTGKMHGYMRMYWAKKILEWSASPEEALSTAITLNDRYELDGRDPNGYTGVLWSIGGVHDRPWKERPVYGKVRYMNDRGAARKFDVQAYIRRFFPATASERQGTLPLG